MKNLISVILICLLLSTVWSIPGKAEASGISGYYKVYADSLNVRSEPSSKGAVIGSLKIGDVVSVSKEAHGWLSISTDQLSGWVAGYYLKKVDGKDAKAAVKPAELKAKPEAKPAEPITKQVTVLADVLRVREGPGTNHKVLGSVYAGDPLIVLNGKEGWYQVESSNGQAGWVSSQYVGEAGAQQIQSGKLQGKVIVIDPGHGGNDPGMIGAKHETLEKELNLQTALLLAEKLRNQGAQVVMTRTRDDEKPKLSERVKVSQSAAADVFVSIHYNSSTKKTSGTLTFYYADKDERVARAIEGRLSQGTGLKSNGIAFGNYHVLRENSTPSALVELGFLSNEKDEEIVRTSDYQQKATEAIAQGLIDYLTL
ncbi:N-acetylmuramoyl-L-alanine amidase [Paenibacillus abyssi]|uniref:N-acetylmuramoyl-L-alanine amidase n=1 Tax=Paenibacillus abyssi TaxID=1340531 RepID=A0A917CRU8_9BACL|nr:N-acetylmuramoyl-L-alanine amidase [Paenibacillus abyssi]GGF94958.1 hypothetical protein GCM10010916_10450 [Paenibacillus abyssi]